ncbi:MAG: hypothetical protein JWP37_1227 [Mucilaginibacter sp.]|nr:hypothetical protein [Mucilaginibacter sp.]
MIVQAEFYESGAQEMEFDVSGLKWVTNNILLDWKKADS